MAVLAVRFTQRASSTGVWCAFGESARCFAPEQVQRPGNSCGIREASVKQRYTFSAVAIDGEGRRDRIDARKFEGFARRRQTRLADLRCEPISGDLVDFGTRPVVALCLIVPLIRLIPQ